jgi:hypothetical protein
MLDEAMYNLMMETQAAIFAAASAGLTSTGGAGEPPQALLQVNAGRAESPSWFLIQAAEFDPEPLGTSAPACRGHRTRYYLGQRAA